MDRSSLTIFAVLVLSVSNLFVGITTQNKLLIVASAAISAALALLYIARDLLRARVGADTKQSAIPTPQLARTRRSPFPLWVFVAILFIVLPALIWFLQVLNQ